MYKVVSILKYSDVFKHLRLATPEDRSYFKVLLQNLNILNSFKYN